MNLRIGDRDSPGAGSVRDGSTVRRTRSAVSEVGGVRERAGRDAEEGVVVRLSSKARELMAQGGGGGGADTIPVLGAAPAEQPHGDGDGDGGAHGQGAATTEPGARDGTAAAGGSKKDGAGAPVPGVAKKLTDEDRQLVSRLAARDTAVHAHEAAHQAAARGLGGAASFTYETGPDGRRYAIGGEVPVALRSGRTPQETIANAQTVRSAALAPSDPSSQDLAVASQASQMEAQARHEVTQTKAEGRDARDPVTNARVKEGGGRGDGLDGDGGDRYGVTGIAARTGGGEPGARVTARADRPTDPISNRVPGPARGQIGGQTGQPEAAAEPEAIDRDHDPLMIFSTLKAERGVVNGHLHSSGGAGCAFCSRAAARYA